MKYCFNCGTCLDDAAKFCTSCGTLQTVKEEQPVAAEEPVVETVVVEEPVAQQPVYVQPVSYAPPAPQISVGTRVMGILSMAFGIAALAFAFICFIFSVQSLDGFSSFVTPVITWSMLFSGAAIASIILSSKSVDEGNQSVMPRLGKIFSLIALPSFGFDLMLIFISLL